jgi:hypothetical protein
VLELSLIEEADLSGGQECKRMSLSMVERNSIEKQDQHSVERHPYEMA